MALLINNQAALLAQIARSDKEIARNEKERVALERRYDKRHLEFEERHRKAEARLLNMDRKSDERFARIEALPVEMPTKSVLAVLDQLPRIKKEIGFKS